MPSKNSATFSVRFHDSVIQRLNRAAELKGVSRTELIREALVYLLEDEELSISDQDPRILSEILLEEFGPWPVRRL